MQAGPKDNPTFKVNVDPFFINPPSLVGIKIGILILRPFEGVVFDARVYIFLGLHKDFERPLGRLGRMGLVKGLDLGGSMRPISSL